MKLFLSLLFLISIFSQTAQSEIIKKIEINGNERIPNETILMFSDVEINDALTKEKLNLILYNLYESNFFENVTVDFNENRLKINVVELPLIKDIEFKGIKAKKIRDQVIQKTKLKPRSSYNEILLAKDKETILATLRTLGYYFSSINTYVEDLGDNSVNIINEIELGKKAKIKKIKFIGDKVFKDRKLRNVIISEEYKFWKFISGKKYLNNDLINFDTRLLKNFYLNQGYYDVEINSSSFIILVKEELILISK